MSRCLLHKTKLDAFKQWMDANGIEHRPGRGDFQVEQIKTKSGQWQCIFDRLDAKEHYTVAAPIEHLVRRFLAAQKGA